MFPTFRHSVLFANVFIFSCFSEFFLLMCYLLRDKLKPSTMIMIYWIFIINIKFLMYVFWYYAILYLYIWGFCILSTYHYIVTIFNCFCCSVAQSCPTLWPHGLQHTRPSCPSPSPNVCPSSCPLHQLCHPTSSSSDALFSFCPQSYPASLSFPMSWLFASDNQNTGVSASASAPSREYSGLISLEIDWLDLLAVQGTLKSLLQHHSMKASIL